MKRIVIVFSILICFACERQDPDNMNPGNQDENDYYFPAVGSNDWETISADSLGWDQDKLIELETFFEDKGTRALIILKDGKIVTEKYWGKDLIGIANFDAQKKWYWASAGKSLAATLTGIAQEQGFLDINKPTSDYLGTGWTSLTSEQEIKIQVIHQLTMTTGLDYQTADQGCTEPSCLEYKSDAGTEWYYYNAPYTLLGDVISASSGVDFQTFTEAYVADRIGMDGEWLDLSETRTYFSTARSMARFGMLIDNQGIWDQDTILADKAYLEAMVNTSQNLNPSYGYLWWLNGKSSIILPGSPASIATTFTPSAPDDLITAAGKNGQFVDILPSENIVMIRMGESPDDDFVPTIFHDDIWKLMTEVIK